MNSVNLDQSNQQKWSDLLTQAVTQPGLMLKAYSAFHGYSLGNQLAALVQCQLHGIEPGPLDTYTGPLDTYKGWLKKGRHVKKGKMALWLCMPLTRKRTILQSPKSNLVAGFESFHIVRGNFSKARDVCFIVEHNRAETRMIWKDGAGRSAYRTRGTEHAPTPQSQHNYSRKSQSTDNEVRYRERYHRLVWLWVRGGFQPRHVSKEAQIDLTRYQHQHCERWPAQVTFTAIPAKDYERRPNRDQ